MTVEVLWSDSPQATHALGVHLGTLLAEGHFIGLMGELGAGKTHFVRGVAQGAGVDPREVSSPTFAIVQPYLGRLTLHHADLYRLRDADELYATGFHDLVEAPGAMLVEWVEQVPGAAPRDALRIWLHVEPDERRRLECTATGRHHEELLSSWVAAVRRTDGR